MSAQASAHQRADEGRVTDLARRVGPLVVVGSLVVTVAVLTWLAVAPTAIAGPLSEAPFSVPATVVLPPDDAGCLQVVDGTGASAEHCVDELAVPAEEDGGYRSTEAWFDDDGRVVVVVFEESDMADVRERLFVIDPDTGEVLDRRDGGIGEFEPAPPFGEEEVYPDGDRVLRFDERGEPDGGEVVLDLGGPPGYRIEQAVLSPDGQWLVMVTWRDEVVVAPLDGSADPYVWTDIPGDRWLDLFRAVHWND